ncbi:lipocalin family protein [Flavobacterium sp. RS13.1]|uniref:lipocalin family protein n=1 Tax=Flavobacterium sp. RS13.1 TaxID=3400345 RepID=UPI003AB0A863
MKKILSTSLLILVTVLFFSCSSDDEKTTEPTIIGKWEFYKLGSVNSNGIENLVDYNNYCTSENDNIEFTTSNFSETYHGSNCQKNAGGGTYTNENNTIRFYYSKNNEGSYYYEIISLSASELKVKKIFNNADVSVSKTTATSGKLASSTEIVLFKKVIETKKS